MAELRHVERAGAENFVAPRPHHDAGHRADHEHFEQAEAEPHRAGERKDSLQSLCRIDPAEIGADPLGHEQKADLQQVGSTPPSMSRPMQRQHDAGQSLHDRVPMEQHRVPVGRERGDLLPARGASGRPRTRPAGRPASRATARRSRSSTAEPRSWLNATWPCSRACCRRWAVGSNDFSPEDSAICVRQAFSLDSAVSQAGKLDVRISASSLAMCCSASIVGS